MKKKIIQWFIGLVFSAYGLSVCATGYLCVLSFMEMMNTVGRQFVGYFLAFIFCLLLFLFLPYLMFKMVEGGLTDKYRSN